ncbi:MAG TPA: hypothetical protein VLA49_20365, partial [Anaerolineales bacterium]|nr:hypothetical protein [Anaerolineales bacterium]
IQTFLAFYITCVRDHQSDPCPGADQIIDRNLGTFFSQGMAQRFKSIEGYFLEGSIPGLGGRGDPDIDTGVYTFYLTH